jgi:multidrug transporter EmrE-like cation transporter
MSFVVFLWSFLLIIYFGFGEYYSKIFSNTPTFKLALVVVFSYALGSLAWLPAIYKVKLLAIIGTIWSIMSILMTIVIGIFVFGETLTTIQIIVIVLAAISIILLTI